MKNFIKYIIAALLFPLGIQAQELDEHYKTAAKNNPGLKAKYKTFEAAMQKIPQVSSLPDPNFSFGYFISPVETRVGPQKARFSLTQMFPWFGTLKAQKDAAALMAESKYQEFLDMRNKLYFQVAAAYYPLYELEQTIALEKENERILNSYKKISTAKFQNGRGAMVDVLRVDILLKDATTNVSILNKKKKPLEIRFNKLLNRSDNTPITIHPNLEADDLEFYYRKDSLLSNPLLEKMDMMIKASEAQERAAIKQGMPKIGAGLDYVVVDRAIMNIPDSGKDVIMPMITVSLPIFRKKYKAAEKEAQLMQEVYKLEKEEMSNMLMTNYEMTWFEAQKQFDLIQLYQDQILESEQSLDLIFTSYGNSGKDFEEVLRMQQQIVKLKKMKASALAVYHTEIAELNYLTAKSY